MDDDDLSRELAVDIIDQIYEVDSEAIAAWADERDDVEVRLL